MLVLLKKLLAFLEKCRVIFFPLRILRRSAQILSETVEQVVYYFLSSRLSRLAEMFWVLIERQWIIE